MPQAYLHIKYMFYTTYLTNFGIYTVWIIMPSEFKRRDLQFRDLPCRDYGVLRSVPVPT
jgi:hypothetical protein